MRLNTVVREFLDTVGKYLGGDVATVIVVKMEKEGNRRKNLWRRTTRTTTDVTDVEAEDIYLDADHTHEDAFV